MPTVTWPLDEICVGSTHQFLASFLLDGEVYDITGATVTMYLKDPSGNVASYDASIVSASGGTASYSVDNTVFDEAGNWYRRWKVVVGSVYSLSSWMSFEVLSVS